MKKFNQRQAKTLERIAAKTAQILPFAQDTPALRADRLAQALAPTWPGFSYFCSTYFPHIFTLPWAPDHQLMFERAHSATGVIAITGFRGLGKTVLMAIAYSIWAIARGERYVIHTASDAELANERTLFTHHELRANKRLLADFPELRPLDDDTLDFYLANKTRVRARGIKQSHRGTINPRTARRPGLIVCDDIDQEINMGNQRIGRQKLTKIIEELAGALDPGKPGRVLWLGNLVHPNYAICQFQAAIIAEIQRDLPDFDPQPHQILQTPQKTLMRFSIENPDGSSAWPEQYPSSRLAELRLQYGPAGYQREMLGLPVIEGNLFKHDWFTLYHQPPPPHTLRRVWLYADPAWGEKGCYKAVIAAGYDGSRFYVLHVWIRQTDNLKFFSYLHDTVADLSAAYRARFRPAIETSYGQARLLTEFDRWALDSGRQPISHFFKRVDNRENKNLRIERTETFISTAKVLFPQGQDTPTLLSQFLTYPDGYIDGPDALAGCLERFLEYTPARNRVAVRRFRF